jgi:hypothetical protein
MGVFFVRYLVYAMIITEIILINSNIKYMHFNGVDRI